MPTPCHPNSAVLAQAAAGLSRAEAADRLEQFGPNQLAERPPRAAWKVFLDQFRNRLILILLGAAVLAFVVTRAAKDPLVITAVVLVNALLGFVQEQRAEASVAALKRMLVTTSRVRRDGAVIEVPAAEVVPGDLVLVEAGDRIPADGTWSVAAELEVDESAFTGESAPVPKTAGTADNTSADNAAAGFMNTTVTRGRGELHVSATGMQTALGRLALLIDETDAGPTPLQREITQLANRLTVVAGIAVAAMIAIETARGTPFATTILDAVALAVAAIPEGLPAVLTVTLAVGTHQLAKRQAIVKRLSSVETLGCTSVICTDKTGTLTLNEMTATELWCGFRTRRISGGGYHVNGEIEDDTPEVGPVLEAAALCNDARLAGDGIVGDPTEAALVVLAAKGGVDADRLRVQRPRIAELPFASARMFMATVHGGANDEALLMCVKGAPDVVLDRCASVRVGDLAQPMDEATRVTVLRANEQLAGAGLRVLAVATRPLGRHDLVPDDDLDTYVRDLRLVGLIGILDPPRAEAGRAIAECRDAGIAVKMITGDHAVTAGAIAGQLGLTGGVMTGAEVEQLDDDALVARLEGVSTIARVKPEHKLRLVRLLRDQGQVVAMTGDGVNDAPALKGADIGVAMGITGTEVTKEAASMVLADDNFATIVDAVRGGRTVYDNIVKFVQFQLATNFGAIITILTAALLGFPDDGTAIFSAIAVLWVNLIMDGPPALALSVDPPDPATMRRRPRRLGTQILDTARLVNLVATGAFMAAGTLLVYGVASDFGGNADAEPRARILAFTTFVLFQVFNIFNVRSATRSVFARQSLRNTVLWCSIGGVVALQVLAVSWTPLQRLLTGSDVVADVTAADWAAVTLVAASILVLEEVRKLFRRHRAHT